MKNRGVVKSLWLITQVGFSMLAPIGVGAVAGYYLDLWLGTSVLFIFFLILGVVAGYRNVWKMLRKYINEEPPTREPVVTKKKLSPAEEEFRQWQQSRKDKHSLEADGDEDEKSEESESL